MLTLNSIKKMSTNQLVARLIKEFKNRPSTANAVLEPEDFEVLNRQEKIDLLDRMINVFPEEAIVDPQTFEVSTPEDEYIPTPNPDKKLRKSFRRAARKFAKQNNGTWTKVGEDYVIQLEDGERIIFSFEEYIPKG